MLDDGGKTKSIPQSSATRLPLPSIAPSDGYLRTPRKHNQNTMPEIGFTQEQEILSAKRCARAHLQRMRRPITKKEPTYEKERIFNR